MENTYPRAFLILAARGDYRQPIDLNAFPADDDPDKGYKLLFHTDTLIQNRLNAILLMESLILAATASLGENGLVVKAIAFPALIFTIVRWHGLSPLERSYSWMANAGCNGCSWGQIQ